MYMATASPHDGDVHCDSLPHRPTPPRHDSPHGGGDGGGVGGGEGGGSDGGGKGGGGEGGGGDGGGGDGGGGDGGGAGGGVDGGGGDGWGGEGGGGDGEGGEGGDGGGDGGGSSVQSGPKHSSCPSSTSTLTPSASRTSFTCTDWLAAMLTCEPGASILIDTNSPHDGNAHCDVLPHVPTPPSHTFSHMGKCCALRPGLWDACALLASPRASSGGGCCSQTRRPRPQVSQALPAVPPTTVQNWL